MAEQRPPRISGLDATLAGGGPQAASAESKADTVSASQGGAAGERKDSLEFDATLDGQSAEAVSERDLAYSSGDFDGPMRLPLATPGFPVANWDRYEFIRLLGRGGMGSVFLARDQRLGRLVALKFITSTNPDTTARFIQEARAQSRIEHPNVCKVYEVGTVEGKPYIAMQFVNGESLDQARRSLSRTEKVQLVRDVARAIHSAHELGIIHRDIKPSNIMVERTAEGERVPVVMDFGLARESGENKGLTESGAVLGTPAYMSPEQARGEVRRIDRRSDVYGLGATLYDLLTGRPPFEEETVVNLLLKVVDENPAPMRRHDPTVPDALELIVATCLHKEASQRYATALALAEDLDRFLQSQRLVARKLSLSYRVRYFARRNRALTGVGVALLVSVIGFVGYGIRTVIVNARMEALAQKRAALQRQLGEDIKEIEWLLRAAYGLPLHDTAFEQTLVVRRMAAIEQKRDLLGTASVAPVHRALGLGRLALHQFEAAIAELIRAQRAGDESAELHYALGRARGALFQQRLEEARRSGEPSWVEKRRQELSVELLTPALLSLEKSRGLDLQAPEYLRGLIALYRDQPDEALALAQAAKQKAPWLYEAEELAGDAYAARGLHAKTRGLVEPARQSLTDALSHYQAALAMGRSVSHLYEKAAEMLLRIHEIDREQGKPVLPLLQQARELSDSAITAAPRSVSGYTKKAYALFHQSCASASSNQNPSELVKELLQVGDRALALDPRNGYALDAVGSGLGCLGSYEQSKGRSPLPVWKDAMARLRHAAEVLPYFPWAYNDYGGVLLNFLEEKAKSEALTEAEVRAAEQWILKATELDPSYSYPLSNLSRLYLVLAYYQLGRGQSPQASVERSVEYAQRALANDPTMSWAKFTWAASYLSQAEFALWSGKEPTVFTERCVSIVTESLRQNPKAAEFYILLLQARWLESEWQRRQSRPAEAMIAEARLAAQRCHALHPPFPDCHVNEVQLLLTLAAVQRSQGRAADTIIAQAWEVITHASQLSKVNFDVMVMRAEVNLWRGRAQDLQEALSDVQQARSLQPHAALPIALHGRILLAQALRVTGKQRQDLVARAVEALGEAGKQNPLLLQRYAAELAQAQRLAGSGR